MEIISSILCSSGSQTCKHVFVHFYNRFKRKRRMHGWFVTQWNLGLRVRILNVWNESFNCTLVRHGIPFAESLLVSSMTTNNLVNLLSSCITDNRDQHKANMLTFMPVLGYRCYFFPYFSSFLGFFIFSTWIYTSHILKKWKLFMWSLWSWILEPWLPRAYLVIFSSCRNMIR